MIEVLKKMVEALEWCHGGEPIGTAEAIKAGKQAIAELKSLEPVGHIEMIDIDDEGTASAWFTVRQSGLELDHAIYTHPPQRTWVGLANDELTDLFYNTNLGQASAVAQAIELLKEKNT